MSELVIRVHYPSDSTDAPHSELMHFMALPRIGDTIKLVAHRRGYAKPAGRFLVLSVEHSPCVDLQTPGIDMHVMPVLGEAA